MMKDRKKTFILIGIICSIIAVIAIFYPNSNENLNEAFSYASIANAAKSNEFIYLSDIDYDTKQSKAYSILKDTTSAGGKITVKVDGEWLAFDKGMWAHAASTLVYDISAYNYDYFTAYAGLNNSAASSSNGVKFYVYTSVDGKTWDLKTEAAPEVTKPGAESRYFKVDIKGAKYLKLIADPNGSNGNDHSVYADARLMSKDYDPATELYQGIKKVDYYDEILRKYDVEYNYNNNYKLVLEREIVNKLGYWNLQKVIKENEKAKAAMDWIFSDIKITEQIVEVGNISDTSRFMTALADLYDTYKDSLKEKNGDVYQKMMIGMAAGWTDRASSPLTFNHFAPKYEYIERYSIFKKLYDDGLFLYGNGFKEYHVEFFRMMMNVGSRNDELTWLNYMGRAKKYALGVYSYVQYVKPNYSKSAKPHLYDIANKNKYETKFHLAEYGVPFADDTTRYWMVMEAGGICWNQARFASAIIKMMGRPSIGVYQPDHESALYYVAANSDGTGKGSWGITGNIFGWGRTSNAWYGGNRTRTLFNWAGKSFTFSSTNGSKHGDSAGYIYLAQANLNNYEVYKKSLYYNLIANSYSDNNTKLSIYNKSLNINSINLDSYDYKIQMYKALNKTSAEWHQLALDVIANYTFYPMAMGDLMNLIKPYLNGVDRVDIDQKYYDALLRAKKATAADIWQTTAAQQIASARLGSASNKLATFSFDGANAGKIVLSKEYDAFPDIMWKYSLDGGATKSAGTTSHAYQLSKEEIAKINDTDDIKIYIVGLTESKPTYTIDIVKGTISDTLYGNDLENRVVGVGQTYEWRYSETDEWTSYADSAPDNTGDKTLYVRNGAVGNALASESVKFTFTEDNQPDTRKYITVNQLSIEEYYTQSKDTGRPFYAPNAIDGNIHTLWHTDFALDVRNDKENKPFITIKLENPKYISAVEFIQKQYKTNDPDYIKNARIYVSMDNKNWTLAGQIENLPQNIGLRVIDFEESIYGQYVKIEMDTHNMFASLAMVNIFKDITKQETVVPTAAIDYDIETKTNKDVLVRLRNSSETVTVTNNGGSDTYVFTENGSFTFEFENKAGVKGTATATVDWIDKEAPTATIEYSIEETSMTRDAIGVPTNKTVTATLVPSEPVKVTNNGTYSVDEDGNVIGINGNILEGYTVDDAGDIKDANGNFIVNMNRFTYEFYTNGEFTFEFEDLAGNKGKATATVDWIDITAPRATVKYDITDLTNQDVTVTLTDESEEIIILNNDGNNTYTFKENDTFTFEFEDLAGNTGTATATVDWIDKEVPTATVKYDITETTDKDVTVTLIDESEEITITNNNGSNTYTFKENGEFTFEFVDIAGNKGVAIAKVDWIEKEDDNKQDDNNNNNSSGDNNDNKPSEDDNNNPSDNPNNDDNNNNDNEQKPNDGEDNNQNNKPSQPSNGNNSDKVDNNKNDNNFSNPTTNDYFPMYRNMIIIGIVVLAYITKKLI